MTNKTAKTTKTARPKTLKDVAIELQALRDSGNREIPVDFSAGNYESRNRMVFTHKGVRYTVYGLAIVNRPRQIKGNSLALVRCYKSESGDKHTPIYQQYFLWNTEVKRLAEWCQAIQKAIANGKVEAMAH
jgi:hypothetical protein